MTGFTMRFLFRAILPLRRGPRPAATTMPVLDDLPPGAVARIGSFLCAADQRSCVLAAHCLGAVFESHAEHTIELTRHCSASKLRRLPRIVAHVLRLMPGLRRVVMCFHGADGASLGEERDEALRRACGLLSGRGVSLAVRMDYESSAHARAVCNAFARAGVRVDELACSVSTRAGAASIAAGLALLGDNGVGRFALTARGDGMAHGLCDPALLRRVTRLQLVNVNGTLREAPSIDLSLVPGSTSIELHAIGSGSAPCGVKGGKVAKLVARADAAGFPLGIDAVALEDMYVIDVACRGGGCDMEPCYAFARSVRAAAGRRRAPLRVPFVRKLLAEFGGGADVQLLCEDLFNSKVNCGRCPVTRTRSTLP